MAVLNYPDYVFERWHGTLITIAIALFAVIFNTFLAKKLPLVEAFVLILHVAGLFIIIIPLWALAPIGDAKTVFTKFTNSGEWNSDGTATMVGLVTAITAMIGYDCTVHMCMLLCCLVLFIPNPAGLSNSLQLKKFVTHRRPYPKPLCRHSH